MDYRIVIPSGIVFDFNNMVGAGRLQAQEVEQALQQQGAAAEKAVCELRSTGFAKKHLSKDGTPEHVYSKHLRSKDVVIFLGVGGSYLGNKVLFDAFGGYHWNTSATLRQGQPCIYFSGNNLDPVDCNSLLFKMSRLALNSAEQGKKLKIMLVPISKSGTTLETISAFTYFYANLSQNADIDLDCTVVTDLKAPVETAPLLQLAEKFGWERFDIKEGIGGRFSIMTDPRSFCAVRVIWISIANRRSLQRTRHCSMLY